MPRPSVLLPRCALSLLLVLLGNVSLMARPIRVLVWDEQQPAQKQAYTNFLGNQIASYLSGRGGFAVRTARLDDPEQGLSTASLDDCDVLVWWGHVRNGEVSPETGKKIVERIRAGRLSLLTLHSAHWSAPFMEAMNERSRQDVLARLAPNERATVVITETNQYAQLRTVPRISDRLTPASFFVKPASGPISVWLVLPNCCFPAYRADGKPSELRVLLAKHPIARGVPSHFIVSQTEMYNEPFHVPPPDEVVMEERWSTGEWFRSVATWRVGQGRVVYFRPGHETYPVFHDANVLKVVENTVRWLGRR